MLNFLPDKLREERIMLKKYIVRLTTAEHRELEELVNRGRVVAYKRRHTQILLKANISEVGEGWNDAKISEAFDVSLSTVERTRYRLVEKSLESAINRAKQMKTRRRCRRTENRKRI